jgi:hypothetical protein
MWSKERFIISILTSHLEESAKNLELKRFQFEHERLNQDQRQFLCLKKQGR